MISPIQQLYYAWDISHKKSVSDDSRFTGVLSEARVDLNPHQVEAALFAFKSPLSKGAILADEVGLGKTIEAGIILSEMWAENKRNILIVVPASLRNQWNIELMEKFYLPSFILDSESFEEGQVQISNGEKSIYICSYNFAVTNAEYFKNISWDLIVFDEAHKLRNVYKKSNVMANALRAAFRNYKKVLLTATPLQNNLKELYGLISIIDPEFFSSLDTFADQYNSVTTRDKAKFGELKGRLAHIIHRTLRNQVEEYVNFTKRTAFVQEYYPTDAEINLYEQVSEYLMREGTYGVPERQRPLLSLLVRKIMSSSAYALGFTLERFIHRLQEYKQTGLLSSALACVNSDIDGSNDEYDIYNSDTPSSKAIYNDIDAEIEELRSYCNMAHSIGEETKSKELLNALAISFEKIRKLGGQKKALIFTESRRTQEYLYKYLTENGYKDKVICFNGTNSSDEAKSIYRLWLMQYAGTNRISGSTVIDKKQAIVDTFRDKAEILIATEAGAEGINLQFCSLVVNKLRVRQSEDVTRMDTYNRHLWYVATSILNKSISSIDNNKHTFELHDTVAPDIPTGTYILNKESDQFIQLRYGHPLGQYVVEKALKTDVADAHLVFDLDSYPYKSALVEQYKGQCGSACVYRVSSSNKYDSEEQLIACAQTDQGEILPPEFIFKLLELDCISDNSLSLDALDVAFKKEYEKQLNNYKLKIEERTNEYVDYEINKYEMWAEDQLVPLRKEVMELSREHDALRRQIRKEHNASAKLQLKKEENLKAKALNQKRAKLFQMEDEYNDKVDSMTSKLQSSMENSVSSNIMFRIKWEIK